MAIKTYSNKNCDLDVLFHEIEAWFVQRNYKTQTHQNDETRLIQATQAEAWRVAAGASRAFNVQVVGEPNNFSVELSTGAWATNLAAGGVAALLTGGATLLISGATIGWSKKIEADITEYIEQRVQYGVKAKSAHEQNISSSQQQLNEKLRQLREAYDNGYITEAAYNTKKMGIESQTQASVELSAAQVQMSKLHELLNAGILSQDEFEDKKEEIERGHSMERETPAAKLSAALAAGIITQEEYATKKAEMDKNQARAERLKALENARDAGILSDAEFDAKKAALA